MNNKYSKELLKLVRRYPKLPIIPFTHYEVVGEDNGYWMGSITDCLLGKYTIWNDRYHTDEGMLIEDYYSHNEDEFEIYQPDDIEIERLIMEKFKDKWINGILLYVGYPEVNL